MEFTHPYTLNCVCETQSKCRVSSFVRAFNLGLQKYRAVDIFDWGSSFKGKNVHEQVHFFNKTILNIFHNYIPNKTILCNDKDPPWFNNEIRKILTKKMRYSNSM